MTISYPLTLPARPSPSRFKIVQASFSAITQSPWTASQQAQLNQGQLWSIEADYPPMGEDDARNWAGTLAALNGRFGTFLFGDPKWKAPRGNWGAAPTVNGAGQSGQSLAVNNLPSSGVIRAGDLFQLGTGSTSRLYMVTQDATASSGAATLDIWPRLRSAPSSGAAIVTARPQSVFRLSAPAVERSFEPFRFGFSLSMLEAL